MILDQTIKVTPENGPRPAGAPDRCFYCHEPLGADHKTDCTLRGKTVVVKVSMELVMRVPADWDKDEAEFYLNGSSSCSDNLLNRLNEQKERMESAYQLDGSGDRCFCWITEGELLRDATEDDHKRMSWQYEQE